MVIGAANGEREARGVRGARATGNEREAAPTRQTPSKTIHLSVKTNDKHNEEYREQVATQKQGRCEPESDRSAARFESV